MVSAETKYALNSLSFLRMTCHLTENTRTVWESVINDSISSINRRRSSSPVVDGEGQFREFGGSVRFCSSPILFYFILLLRFFDKIVVELPEEGTHFRERKF